MRTVDILEAASSFEKLVTLLEAGEERAVIISKDGRPVAKLVPLRPTVPAVRFGVAKGKLRVAADFDEPDARIAQMFNGGSIEPRT